MADGGDMEISLEKLPIKRLEIIEESVAERISPEIEYEVKTVNLIRRIDFAWALERDAKKQKKTKESQEEENRMREDESQHRQAYTTHDHGWDLCCCLLTVNR